jgi:hypothetical protein
VFSEQFPSGGRTTSSNDPHLAGGLTE